MHLQKDAFHHKVNFSARYLQPAFLGLCTHKFPRMHAQIHLDLHCGTGHKKKGVKARKLKLRSMF